MRQRLCLVTGSKLLPKPGKALMRALDPKAYILKEYIDAKHHEWGFRYRVYSGDGKPYCHDMTPQAAWRRSSCRLKYEIAERAAKGLGILK